MHMRELEKHPETQTVAKQLFSLHIVTQNNLERVLQRYCRGRKCPSVLSSLMEVVYKNTHVCINNTI